MRFGAREAGEGRGERHNNDTCRFWHLDSSANARIAMFHVVQGFKLALLRRYAVRGIVPHHSLLSDKDKDAFWCERSGGGEGGKA